MKFLVKRPGVCLKVWMGTIGGMKLRSIQIPAYFAGFPFNRKGVESIGENATTQGGSAAQAPFVVVSIAVMAGGVSRRRLMTEI